VPQLPHTKALPIRAGGRVELVRGESMKLSTQTGSGSYGVGVRRSGKTVRWSFYCPNNLLFRFDTLVMNQASHRAVYGARSQILTELLKTWLEQQPDLEPARAIGFKRRTHGVHEHNTRLQILIPEELAARVGMRFSSANGGQLFGFQTWLLTSLLRKWVHERETALIKESA